MSKDFEPFLKKLQERRFDELRKQLYLSDAFLKCDYEASMKYVLECMQPIPPLYNEHLYHTCQRVADKLQRDLAEEGIFPDFRYQGSRQTDSAVTLYGDIEMMLVLAPQPEADAKAAVRQLSGLVRQFCENSSMFRTVDHGCDAAIRVRTMKKPFVSLSILPCIWVDTDKYKTGGKEISRGIAEYDFKRGVRKSYLPFRNIARINQKDDKVRGNLKRLSRMLRCLQLDAPERINLTQYELTCALYNMSERHLQIEPRYIVSLLPAVSDYLDQLARYGMFRKVMSPSKKELVFGHDENKGKELQKLKNVVDDVIIDLQDELRPLNKDLTNGFPYE